MSKRKEFNGLPGDFEQLSEYSNPDLRLAPEYAEVEEAYRKIRSFKEAVDLLEGSEASYNKSVKAVASAWPEAYETFQSLDEMLGDIPEKHNAEKVINSGFNDFKEDRGEVATRYRELRDAVQEAEELYQQASASLNMQIQHAVFQDKKTPLDYALQVSESESFERRAEEIKDNLVGSSDRSGLMNLLLEEA